MRRGCRGPPGPRARAHAELYRVRRVPVFCSERTARASFPADQTPAEPDRLDCAERTGREENR